MSTSSKYLASPQIQLKNNKSYRTLLTAETSFWYVTTTIWSPPICKLHLWITWQPIHGERAPISISVQQATGDAFCAKLNPSLTFHLTCPSSAQQLGGVAHNAPLPSSTFLFFSLSLCFLVIQTFSDLLQKRLWLFRAILCCCCCCRAAAQRCCWTAWCLWAFKDIQNNQLLQYLGDSWTIRMPQLPRSEV